MVAGDFWNKPDELVKAFEKTDSHYVFFITDIQGAAKGSPKKEIEHGKNVID